jgi:choline dehydrogenase
VPCEEHIPSAAFEREVFDYIVVGAGAAGCVLANRLSADGTRTVCLLDAGPPDNNILLKVPAGVYRVPENPKFAWQFTTEPHPSTGNRRIALPQGRTLGGSTSINGMAYARGSPSDFDDWARRGNSGWAYHDVLPYFMRSERWFGAESSARGVHGELPVTEPEWRHPLCEAFINAAGSFGLRTDYDYNTDAHAGVTYYQRYIANGWRISAATAFLRPAARRRNLDIRTRVLVAGVLFADKRAVGIRYMPATGGPIRQVMARREIVLSAGAINTPKILHLSGVGDPALLSQIGIPTVHELPGHARPFGWGVHERTGVLEDVGECSRPSLNTPCGQPHAFFAG